MTGYITKGIGGFYYVKTSEGIVECKPRGIFRKQKITPVAGDVVTLETENGGAVIAAIAPRRNVFVRAALAEGKLSQTRYDSYCAMYDEVKDVKEWQYPLSR